MIWKKITQKINFILYLHSYLCKYVDKGVDVSYFKNRQNIEGKSCRDRGERLLDWATNI